MRYQAEVDFSKRLRRWDGFGVNYVETSQTRDYTVWPQDYGGFSSLSESDRQKVIEMIFGDDGLKLGIVKMFLDPFHQNSPESDSVIRGEIDLSDYDHATTTEWLRYFAREGLAKTSSRGDELKIITTLYGPPGWITRQKVLRGRDLDLAHRIDCARYMISWARYLREAEGSPVNYISLHNEGEDYHRWTADGLTDWEKGHDYNLYWPPEQVVDFLRFMRGMLDDQGMRDVGLTLGETTNWYRFSDWGYAYAIADDPEALRNLGLITSHGFLSFGFGRWFGDARSLGNDILRARKPGLHSWVTSMSWGKMAVDFINQIRLHIYAAKVNAVIPWAVIQRPSQWVGGDPNPGTAFRVDDEGNFTVLPGYYFYKQVCRAGQPGMAVVRAVSADSEVGLIGFAGNGTGNPDAFVVLNLSERDKSLRVRVAGSEAISFDVHRTSSSESYVPAGDFAVKGKAIDYIAPGRSVTTFFAV